MPKKTVGCLIEFDDSKALLRGRAYRSSQGRPKDARKRISLVKAKLPPLTKLPDPATIASIHADILTLERLSTELKGKDCHRWAYTSTGTKPCRGCRRALEAVILALQTVQEVPWLEPYLVGQKEAPTVVGALFEKISDAR